MKAVIDAYPGNLNAAEAAFEELANADVEDRAPLFYPTHQRSAHGQEGPRGRHSPVSSE